MLLLALCAAATLATLRLTSRTLYSDLSVGSAAIFSLALVVCFIVTTGSVLACLESFTANSFAIALGGYTLAVAGLSFRYPPRPELVVTRAEAAAPFLIAIIAAVLYLPPSRIDIGGQDPACYVAAASVLAYNGNINLFSPAYRAFSDDELARDLNLFDPATLSGQIFPGAFLNRWAPGTISILFPRGPSYLLGFGYLVSRGSAAYLSNSLYAFLAVFVFFMFARAVVPLPAAVCAALLLACCPAQIWFGRATYSEVCSQFYIFFGLYHLLRVFSRSQRQNQNTVEFLIVIWLLGLSSLMRVDHALIVIPLIAALPLAAETWFSKWRVLLFQALLVGSLALVSLDNRLTALIHFIHYYPSQLFVSQRPWLYAGVVFAGTLPLYLPKVREFVQSVVTRMFRELRTEWAAATALGLIALMFVLGFSVRTQIIDIPFYGSGAWHNANVRMMSDQIFPRLSVLTGLPILLAGFFGMFLMLRAPRVSPAVVLLAAVLLGYSSQLLVNQMNSPGLYWATRRYVPVIIPALILFGCGALAQLELFSSRKLNRSLFGTLVAVSILPMLFLDRSILWWGEMNGADSAAKRLRQLHAPENTVLIGDAAERTRGFTLRFLGNFDVLIASDLSKSKELQQRIEEKLRPLGKQLIYFSGNPEDAVFTQGQPVEYIAAPYWRLGENLERFPRTPYTRDHGIYYQLR